MGYTSEYDWSSYQSAEIIGIAKLINYLHKFLGIINVSINISSHYLIIHIKEFGSDELMSATFNYSNDMLWCLSEDGTYYTWRFNDPPGLFQKYDTEDCFPTNDFLIMSDLFELIGEKKYFINTSKLKS